jgi:hypothetical protein
VDTVHAGGWQNERWYQGGGRIGEKAVESIAVYSPTPGVQTQGDPFEPVKIGILADMELGQLAVFHRFLRPQAGRRSRADRVAEHVTYRDVRNDEEPGELHALGAFPSPDARASPRASRTASVP